MVKQPTIIINGERLEWAYCPTCCTWRYMALVMRRTGEFTGRLRCDGCHQER